ncbi:hypothetical protein DSO57_1006026 [Entomophthora muscae]|uniref:Uncharacterized protein n=1 Tax=Entomophthora muscae TaxID=34485 RepID=A0ACC2T824_9FUNG|nr:hypothetical protein DSO57_1006026 [Entomophthora muscae]
MSAVLKKESLSATPASSSAPAVPPPLSGLSVISPEALVLPLSVLNSLWERLQGLALLVRRLLLSD